MSSRRSAKPAEDIPPLADGESDPLVILEHAHEWLSRLDVKLIANKFVGKAVKVRTLQFCHRSGLSLLTERIAHQDGP